MHGDYNNKHLNSWIHLERLRKHGASHHGSMVTLISIVKLEPVSLFKVSFPSAPNNRVRGGCTLLFTLCTRSSVRNIRASSVATRTMRYREISCTREEITRIECLASSRRAHSPNFSAHESCAPDPPKEKSDRTHPSDHDRTFPCFGGRWVVGKHMSRLHEVHDRSGWSTHSSSLVKHERMARRPRHAIKREGEDRRC